MEINVQIGVQIVKMSYNIFGIVLKVILVTTNKEKNRVYYLTFIILSKFRINFHSLLI